MRPQKRGGMCILTDKASPVTGIGTIPVLCGFEFGGFDWNLKSVDKKKYQNGNNVNPASITLSACLVLHLPYVVGLVSPPFFIARKGWGQTLFSPNAPIVRCTVFAQAGLYHALLPSSLDPAFSRTASNTASSPLTLSIIMSRCGLETARSASFLLKHPGPRHLLIHRNCVNLRFLTRQPPTDQRS